MKVLPKERDDETLFISKQGLEQLFNNFNPQLPQKDFIWTTDYRVEIPIRLKKQGYGSEQPYTLIQMWKEALSKYSHLAAMNYEKKADQWVTISFQEYYNQCIKFAKALITLKIKEYSTVNIIGFNSPQWAMAFYGSIFGHYLPIGLYTTNLPDACQYIANHSECEVVILEDQKQLAKYITILDKVPKIRYFILFKDAVPENLPNAMKGKVLTWNQFLEIGAKKYNPLDVTETLEYRQNIQKPGNCCTFIYTSGTTGPPKAVMISHDNYTWTAGKCGLIFNFDDPLKVGKHRLLSHLPLSHVAAQIGDIIFSVKYGMSVFYPDSTALQNNFVKFLNIAKPTFMVTVPRIWEKIEEKLTVLLAQSTGIKLKLVDWSLSRGMKGTEGEIQGKQLPFGWSISKKLVFNKIKQNLGLNHCENMLFGAAPMRESTRKFFMTLNIYLYNCFGMSELTGPETVTNPKRWKTFEDPNYLKEAGEVLPGLELKIANPDKDGHGEMQFRGRNVFMGYFKNQKETKETLDPQGFVHSGDVGMILPNKQLAITGRIKELIITAGGQNVAPVLIENEINTALPLFSTVIVVGDKLKYLSCLLCLKLKNAQTLSDEVIEYIKARGSSITTIKEALVCKKLQKIIQDGIDKANEKAISNAQKIIRFKILPLQLTVDSGLLTPTMKLKRKLVNQRFAPEIASMYVTAKL